MDTSGTPLQRPDPAYLRRAVILRVALLLVGALLLPGRTLAAPFAVRGPGVRPADFRVTVFATNLSFPVGMVQLPDHSLLVAVTEGTSFWNGNGKLIRLVDADGDGVADSAGKVLYSGLAGGLTSLRRHGSLFFTLGQGSGRPIAVLRAGATPDASLIMVGKINFTYPGGGWLHPHSALNVRTTPGDPASCDLFFQVGSDQNFAKTTRTVTLGSTQIAGATGTLEGESIYRLTLTDRGTNVVASNLTRIAKGLRNPAGFDFHPVTGDLYFEDNGIDGLSDPNNAFSADELNVIPAAALGNGTVHDFGYPANYTAFDTGIVVGGGGIQPLVAFQPVIEDGLESEAEGPNDIAFAPPGFPPGLDNGIFVGFHGKWALAGIANDENPLAFVDLRTTNYFHFISNREPHIGHLDGLLSTADSLFASDITSTGATENSTQAGVIYQIKSQVGRLSLRTRAGMPELTWPAGMLQQAPEVAGPWTDLPTASSPHPMDRDPGSSTLYFRVKN